jgi:hypothetical protein
MTNLPVEQVGESQWLATQLRVEPDAKGMQSDFRSQARLHLLHQEQTESHDDIAMLPRHSIELLTVGQSRERFSQVAQCVTVEGAFAGKLPPLSKHGQRYHLATRQRGLRAGTMFFMEAFGLAKVIDHHVQCRKSRCHGPSSASSFSI